MWRHSVPCDIRQKYSRPLLGLLIFVDLARIGLAPLQCECSVVPLDYRPKRDLSNLPYTGVDVEEGN